MILYLRAHVALRSYSLYYLHSRIRGHSDACMDTSILFLHPDQDAVAQTSLKLFSTYCVSIALNFDVQFTLDSIKKNSLEVWTGQFFLFSSFYCITSILLSKYYYCTVHILHMTYIHDTSAKRQRRKLDNDDTYTRLPSLPYNTLKPFLFQFVSSLAMYSIVHYNYVININLFKHNSSVSSVGRAQVS